MSDWKQMDLEELTSSAGDTRVSHSVTPGERRGAEDDRHLWPEVKRLMATVRPRWGLFENVAGHVSMGLDEVLSDLEAEGYTGFPVVVPACAVDAPHRRDRVWIIAHANSHGEPDGTINEQRLSFMADTYNDRSQERHTECSKQGRQEQTDHALPCSQIMAHSDSAFIQRGGGIQQNTRGTLKL